MRLAVPIWEDKVSPVLDTAAKLLILETSDREKISRVEADLSEQDISRRCYRIRMLEVDVLICGAVSRSFADLLKASGIDVIPGISGDIEDILQAYFSGTLHQSKFLMPGCGKSPVGKDNRSRGL
jgi:predicted Fe-Mo cluster-binding NifX family protein